MNDVRVIMQMSEFICSVVTSYQQTHVFFSTLHKLKVRALIQIDELDNIPGRF